MEADYGKLAMDVFDELNLSRQIPTSLVTGMSGKLEYFNDKLYSPVGADAPTETYEGAKAVNALKLYL